MARGDESLVAKEIGDRPTLKALEGKAHSAAFGPKASGTPRVLRALCATFPLSSSKAHLAASGSFTLSCPGVIADFGNDMERH